MSKLTWEEVRKEFKFTPEEEEEMRIEKEIIGATIDARRKENITQTELSKKSGIQQPSIAKIENLKRSPQLNTLVRLLYPLGYTLKVVPINKK